MKAIFVESKDNFLAKSGEDDMLWTPSLDKKLFKLLSCAFGGICIVSKHTYNLLPNIMLKDKNRQFIIAERTGPNSLYNLNKLYPNGILIGGPSFLWAAYNEDVIDTFIITTINKEIKCQDLKFKNPFLDILKNIETNCLIKFDEMEIRIYRNKV